MIEINNTTKNKINLKKTKDLAESFLKFYKRKNWSLSLALIGSKKMRSFNNDYRGIDQTTDVLSFAGDDEDKYLGEVIINIDEVKKVIKYLEIFEKAPKLEYLFYFIFVHGLLHLVGYDDSTEKGRVKMVELGKVFLKKNGII